MPGQRVAAPSGLAGPRWPERTTAAQVLGRDFTCPDGCAESPCTCLGSRPEPAMQNSWSPAWPCRPCKHGRRPDLCVGRCASPTCHASYLLQLSCNALLGYLYLVTSSHVCKLGRGRAFFTLLFCLPRTLLSGEWGECWTGAGERSSPAQNQPCRVPGAQPRRAARASTDAGQIYA